MKFTGNLPEKGQNLMKNEKELKGNFTQVPNSIIRDPKLSPHAKTVFVVIKSYSPSFPSYSRILRETGIGSKTTLSKCLTELKNRKFIVVKDSPDHRSNLYEFPPPPLDLVSTQHGPVKVQQMDTNKNKVKITSEEEAPRLDAIGPSETKKIFAEAESSLGTVKKKLKSIERPTFVIDEAP